MSEYALPATGLPPQTRLLTGRAVFTEAYAVIPRGVMTDIVTSFFPGWQQTRAWIIARPLTGFAETFCQIIVEVESGGGSNQPEPDPGAEGVLFITGGTLELGIGREQHALRAGSYAYLAPGTDWSLANRSGGPATFVWVRKAYQRVPDLTVPSSFVCHESEVTANEMEGTRGVWSTKRFVDTADLRHDMHVNIVHFQPGGVIPFEETHVMEHGLYVLQGKAVYLLNRDWVEVERGDFMWLRAFCPQACYAGGPEPFRYLLYKDVNRLPSLKPGG